MWLEDILVDAIRADSRLEPVTRPPMDRDVDEVLRDESVDVLVTHATSRAVARSAELLFANPRLRIVSLGSGRANTAFLSLSPTQEQLGDLSLPALIDTIACDHAETVTLVDLSSHGG